MNICVIPARGGSKRIPRKNIKLFHGKPIIAYSIEAALGSSIDQVIVSTDDEETSKLAKKLGVQSPFLRPPELSENYVDIYLNSFLNFHLIFHNMDHFYQDKLKPLLFLY